MRTLGLLTVMTVAVSACSEPGAPSMSITVQKRIAGRDCWSTMTPDQPLSDALQIEDTCPDQPTSDASAIAGADRIRLVIDYGPDVHFSPGTVPPNPKVKVRVDGVESSTAIDYERGTSHPKEGARTYFTAGFLAPAHAPALMTIEAEATAGFGAQVDRTFALEPLVVTPSLDECPSTPCSLVGGVGTTPVTVTVPGETEQDVVVNWRLDGVLQPNSRTIRAKNPIVLPSGGTGRTATEFLQVPEAREGASWSLTATVGARTVDFPVSPTLVSAVPTLTVADCAKTSGCVVSTVGPDVPVTVTIEGTATRSVTLSYSIDEVLQPYSRTEPIDTPTRLPSGKDARTTSFFVTPPSAPDGARWRVHAHVGSADVTSPEITLSTPPLEVNVSQCMSHAGCSFTGEAGSAAVTVTVPGTRPQDVTLTSLIDNVPQTVSAPFPAGTSTLLPDGGPAFVATQFVPVPGAHEGALWQLIATARAMRGASPLMTIEAPALQAELTCGNSCVLAAGTVVGLRVIAPAAIRTNQATFNTTVNGVPSVTAGQLNLTTVDANAGTVSGITSLPVPSSAGETWKIDVTVGSYSAPSIIGVITSAPDAGM